VLLAWLWVLVLPLGLAAQNPSGQGPMGFPARWRRAAGEDELGQKL